MPIQTIEVADPQELFFLSRMTAELEWLGLSEVGLKWPHKKQLQPK
mgnify:CR=1 FL=1